MMLVLSQGNTQQQRTPPCGQKEKKRKAIKRERNGQSDNKHRNRRRKRDRQRFELKQVAAAWRGGLNHAQSLHSHGRAGRAAR